MRRFSDEWAIVATIDPDAYTANTYLSDEIDLSKWQEIAAVCMVGDLGSSGTVDFELQGSTTSGGSYATISGKAATQLTQAGTDSDKQVILHLRPDDQARRYVKLQMITATATSDAGAVVFGKPRYAPPADQDLASVDEVV